MFNENVFSSSLFIFYSQHSFLKYLFAIWLIYYLKDYAKSLIKTAYSDWVVVLKLTSMFLMFQRGGL